MKRILFIILATIVALFPSLAHAQNPTTGSITITKEATSFDSPGQSLAGIEFQIDRLSGIDVQSEAGRKELEELSVADALEGNMLSDAPLYQRTHLEDGVGVARFTDLPIGAYLVQELPSRIGDVSKATTAPFLVSVPYFGIGGTYYHVAGTPKIQPLTLTLSTSTNTVSPSERFIYTLDASVPLPDASGQLYRFLITTTVPEGVAVSGNEQVVMRGLNYRSVLAAGLDYTFTVKDESEVALRFTPAGLTKLAAARLDHADLTVRFTFDSTAKAGLAHGTKLVNIAYFYPDGYPETDTSRNIPSNEVLLTVRDAQDGNMIPPLPVHPTGPDSPSAPGTPSSPSTVTAQPVIPAANAQVPGSADAERNPSKLSNLALTGANVLTTIIAGASLGTIGLILMRKRRCNDQ